MIDLDALKARLAEYDDYAPKCPKKVERKSNCAPDAILSSDPTYHDYDFTTYAPCCRPEGHAGECRNGRLILGWPGFVTVSALIAEVERLRENAEARERFLRREGDLLRAVERERDELRREVADLRMQRDEHLLDNQHAYDEGYDVGTRRGYEAEHAAVVAWLREVSERRFMRNEREADIVFRLAHDVERGEHRRKEEA